MQNNQQRRKPAIVIPLFFLGLLFVVLTSIIVANLEEKKEKCTKKVDAEVVDLERYTDDEGNREWKVIIGYYYDGEYYEEYSGFCSKNADDKYPVGTELKVKVDPKHPKTFYIKEFDGLNLEAVKIMRTVGFTLMGIAVLIFVIRLLKLLIVGGAVGIAAAQTKKFNQQQAQFYGQNQWNQMNSGTTIYTDDLNNQVNSNYQQLQQGQMNQHQQGNGLN